MKTEWAFFKRCVEDDIVLEFFEVYIILEKIIFISNDLFFFEQKNFFEFL